MGQASYLSSLELFHRNVSKYWKHGEILEDRNCRIGVNQGYPSGYQLLQRKYQDFEEEKGSTAGPRTSGPNRIAPIIICWHLYLRLFIDISKRSERRNSYFHLHPEISFLMHWFGFLVETTPIYKFKYGVQRLNKADHSIYSKFRW